MRKLLLHSAKLKRRYEQSGRMYRVYEIPYECYTVINDIFEFMRSAEKGLHKYFRKNPLHECSGTLIHATDFWPSSILVHISDLP